MKNGGSFLFLFLEFNLGQWYRLLQLQVLQDVVEGIGSAHLQKEEELAATVDQVDQPMLAGVVLLVVLQVIRDVFDPVGQGGHCKEREAGGSDNTTQHHSIC